MKIRELLSDESKWIQHHCAVDIKGDSCDSLDPKAARWCLIGALIKCYDMAAREYLLTNIEKEIQKEAGRGCLISIYNDTQCFQEIKDLVERLDI